MLKIIYARMQIERHIHLNELVDHIGVKKNMHTFTCHMFCEVNPTVFLTRDDPGVTRHGHATCFVYNVESKALTTLSTM